MIEGANHSCYLTTMPYETLIYPNRNPHEYICRDIINTLVLILEHREEVSNSKLLNPESILNYLDNDVNMCGKTHTQKAYNNRIGTKAKCFLDMCEHAKVNVLVDDTKLISYLMYCATRKKCQQGVAIKFDPIQYDELFTRSFMTTLDNEEATDAVLCDVTDPLGFEAMKQHKLAVKTLHDYQLDHRLKFNSWESCYSTVPKLIMSICQRRVKLMKRKRKVDESDNVFVGYHCADEIGNIFNFMNLDIRSHNTSLQKYNNNLRILAIMSSTIFGAVRGETILNAELRDLNFLQVKSKDPSQIDLFIIRMYEGK